MTDNVLRETGLPPDEEPAKSRELPVGSELMIAFAAGAAGWYVILRVVQWLAF